MDALVPEGTAAAEIPGRDYVRPLRALQLPEADRDDRRCLRRAPAPARLADGYPTSAAATAARGASWSDPMALSSSTAKWSSRMRWRSGWLRHRWKSPGSSSSVTSASWIADDV